uniref:transposase n=1 Tax=Salmonella enterica TaxID=28901 RepID=UPI0011179F91
NAATDIPPVIAESIENVLRNLSAEIERLDELLLTHLNQHPELKKDFDLLTSIKSVGFQLGLNMLVILRGHRFDTAGQLAAFLGVVPVEKSSGTSIRGKPKLSKNGPPEIRAKLYLASMCGLRFNPVMKAMYERLCLSGKAKMCAIGALMRKLVHLCYGVLKTQKPFDAEHLSSDARSACKAA